MKVEMVDMDARKKFSTRWVDNAPSPILMFIVPLLGLIYIIVLPIFAVATFILTGGYYAMYHLNPKHPEKANHWFSVNN